MNDLAAIIENGRLEPGVATDIAGGPNDRPDALALADRASADRRRPEREFALRIGGRRVETAIFDASVDPVEDAQHARMRSLGGPIEVVGERGLCADRRS